MKPVTFDEFDEKRQILTKRYLTSKDAYVTGFFFVTLDSLPVGLSTYLSDNYIGGWSEEKIVKVFTSSAVDVTLPQEALKTISSQGLGGYSRTCPLFTQPGNTISISFQVDQDMEITTLLIGWHDYLRKMADGRIEVDTSSLFNVTSNVYGCNIYYCTLLPNLEDVVFGFVGEAVYPTTSPLSDFSHNVNTYDALKHVITFNVEYYETWTKLNVKNDWIHGVMKEKMEIYKSDSFNNTPSSRWF